MAVAVMRTSKSLEENEPQWRRRAGKGGNRRAKPDDARFDELHATPAAAASMVSRISTAAPARRFGVRIDHLHDRAASQRVGERVLGLRPLSAQIRFRKP